MTDSIDSNESLAEKVQRQEREIAGFLIKLYEKQLEIDRLAELEKSVREIGEIRRLENAALRLALRRLEWIDGRCPACDRLREEGHAPGCWLNERFAG